MSNFTQLEVNSIRECVANHINVSTKLLDYANKSNDPDVKNMFESASTKADEAARKLIGML